MGGRMTKWKGVVASVAPMVGLVATTGFLATPAQAEPPCGPVGAIIICGSTTYTTGPTEAIQYLDVVGSTRLELQGPEQNPGLSVSTPGTAVFLSGAETSDGSVVVTIEGFDNIETSSSDNTAVIVENKGTGAANSKLSGGLVQTAGSKSHGLWSYISNPSSMQDTKAQLSFGEVKTAQNESHGLYSLNDGGGEAVAEKEVSAGGAGIVTTLGEEAYGLYAHISNTVSTGAATVSFRQGTVTSEGALSHGLFSRNDGEGNTAVSLSSDGEVTTKSTEAHGALAHNTNNTSTGRTEVQLTSASIKTEGDRSIGLKALADGLSEAVANVASGTVSTLGEMAHGVLAEITNTASEADASAYNCHLNCCYGLQPYCAIGSPNHRR